jgi:sulfatase modifying factor 1
MKSTWLLLAGLFAVGTVANGGKYIKEWRDIQTEANSLGGGWWTNSIKIPATNMVLVAGGTFIMGDLRGDGRKDDRPTHPVTLNTFEMSACEVTTEEMARVMDWAEQGGKVREKGSAGEITLSKETGSSWVHLEETLVSARSIFPSDLQGALGLRGIPCDEASWYGAVAYCNFRSELEGLTPSYNLSKENWPCDLRANGYRLPTEAEWEYAARGGAASQNTRYSGSDSIDEVAWYLDNGRVGNPDCQYVQEYFRYVLHRVGTKKPNALGLFDMSGNAMEWCNDWYGDYSGETQENPTGPLLPNTEDTALRVKRGGGRGADMAHTCCVTARFSAKPDSTSGFRIVRTLSAEECAAREQEIRSQNGKRLPQKTDMEPFVKMVKIPAGSFIMGDSQDRLVPHAQPAHSVTLDSFHISSCEITQSELAQVMNRADAQGELCMIKASPVKTMVGARARKNSPLFPLFGSWQEGESLGVYINQEDFPAEVFWEGAIAYCNYRSESEGLVPAYRLEDDRWRCDFSATGYRLPTEAEWEYAARGGAAQRNMKYSGGDNLNALGWYAGNNGGEPVTEQRSWHTEVVGQHKHAIREKRPNQFGLYDMSGGALEWCNDWYGSYSSNPQTNPVGAEYSENDKEAKRVIRGGHWMSPEADCRVSARAKGDPEKTLAGFRVVRRAD